MTNSRITVPDDVEAAATAPVEADRAVIEAWRAHHGELFGFLNRSTRDAAAAEDLLQDTFLRLTREARAGRMPGLVRPWLFRVAGNLAVSRARRGSTALRWLRLQVDPEARTAESPESRSVRHETSADLTAALGRLSPAARSALLLASEGFTGIEIAAAIGRTDGATRTLMSRARLQLRSELRSRGSSS
jgi:RNA polymerase sigma-70 factor (ECF subfamily)